MKKLFSNIIDATINGVIFIMNFFCNIIYTILIFIMKILNKIFKNKFNKTINYLSKRKRPEIILIIFIYIFSFITIFNLVYFPKVELVDDNIIKKEEVVDDSNKETKVEEKVEDDLYSFESFGKYNLNDINFEELLKVNNDVVSWINVDSTNINYPVVQTKDNEYYLNHSFTKTPTKSGWVFMDYRNNHMNDNNTIFYGHNLINKTSFGSISNIFTNKWYKESNHSIIILTKDKKYTYQIFSIYYSKPVVDYLKVDFDNDSEYNEWLTNLKNKSKKDFNIDVSSNDKIVTLSTCTDDNSGRKVVHGKLISVEDIN